MEQRIYEDLQQEPGDERPAFLDEEMPLDELPFADDDTFNMPVSSINPSKGNVTLLAIKISQQVEEGKVNPIDAALHLNATKKMCEEALEMIRACVVDELEKSNGKTTKHDCKVEKAETGTKYDYSQNPDWVSLYESEKEASERRKAFEDRLKSIPAGKQLVDQETGEVLIGPSKTSTTSFKVTLAK